MTVSEQYLLTQMQTLAANMTGVPQSSGADGTGETGSFQDLMGQIRKAVGTKDSPKDPETKDGAAKGDAAETDGETAPAQGNDKEEVKPELLAANPNAVNVLDLFRPIVVETVEEPVAEAPVEPIPQESVGGPDLALDGGMTQMDTGVDANVDTGVSMDQQPGTFRDTMQGTDLPQERSDATVENTPEPTQTVERAPEAPETPEAPKETAVPEERTADPDKPSDDVPEVKVKTETDEEEPSGEMAGTTGQPVFRDVESAPVKVGETYESVDTEKPDMETKLADTIQTAFQDGQEKIQIQLTPQNLGSLTIEMAKDADGVLQVVIHTATAKAAGVLSDHMDGLQLALRGYSQEEVRIEVQRGEESQQQQNPRQADPDGRGNQQNRQQQRRQDNSGEENSGETFMQRLRLGLSGADEI